MDIKQHTIFVKNLILINIFCFIIYVSIYLIQDSIWNIQISIYQNLYLGSLLFFPHGVRVLAYFLFREKSFLGIFFAHILTGLIFQNEQFNFLQILIRSCFPILGIYFSFILINNIFKIQISNPRIKTIILFAGISSIFNSFFNALYLNIIIVKFDIYSIFFSYFFGDILGCIILFYFLSLIKGISKIIKI